MEEADISNPKPSFVVDAAIVNCDKEQKLILNGQVQDNGSELNTTNKLALSDSGSDTFEPIVKSKKVGKIFDSDSDADNDILANANGSDENIENHICNKTNDNGQTASSRNKALENEQREKIMKLIRPKLIDSDSESEDEAMPFNLMKLAHLDNPLSEPEDSTDKDSEVDAGTVKLVRRKTKLKKTRPRKIDTKPDSDKDDVEKVT